MELRHFRYFVAVADEGSVSEAARARLNTAQPSLSRQLRDLEHELGVALFERRVRGVELTAAGRLFLTYARQILKQTDDAVAAVRDEPMRLRAGMISGLETQVLPQLTTLARAHAKAVEIEVVSAASTHLIQELRDGNLDLAFARPADHAVDLHFEPIGSHRVAAFLQADHPLAARVALRFADLDGFTYIAVNPRVGPFLRGAIDAWGQQRGLARNPDHVAADIASAFSLILATGGFALMPDYAEPLMPASLRMVRLLDGPPPLLLTIATSPLVSSRVGGLVEAISLDWPRSLC